MGVIVFNGVSSEDYHIQVEHLPNYEVPEREYDVVHVPGRNGDIFMDKGSFRNVTRSYEIAAACPAADFMQMAHGVSEWLHAASGYARLEDSYEPDFYRLAMYTESAPVSNVLGRAARATISFDCKPQRFLKSGEQTAKFSGVGVLFNPTMCDALPIVTVRGSGKGVLRIGGYTVTISDVASFLTIDSEIQDVYKGTVNKNSAVTLVKGFPKLKPKGNEISFSGGITSVEVVPKWWTL